MINKYHFAGKLSLSNVNLSKMNYGVVNNSTSNITFNSITDILDDIYHSESPYISITIRTLDDSTKLIHKGELNICRDKHGVYDYCVSGSQNHNFALGLELFHLTGKEMAIHIEHLEQKEIKQTKVLEEVS